MLAQFRNRPLWRLSRLEKPDRADSPQVERPASGCTSNHTSIDGVAVAERLLAISGEDSPATGHNTRSVYDRYNITNEADKLGAMGRLEASTVRATGTEKGQSGQVQQFAAS